LGLVAAIALGMGAIALLQLPNLRSLQARNQNTSTTELRRNLEAERVRLSLVQKLPSLGYGNVISDWAFLQFLQYFGDEPARKRTDYSLSPEFFEVAIAQNPRFLETYTFLSTSTSIYAGLPERSVAIMSKGLDRLTPAIPQAYYAWRTKAIDQLLFLGDAKGAQTSFETAAEWAEKSAEPGSQNVVKFSRQTAQFLANNPKSTYAQFSAWVMVLSNAPDDRTRQTAAERIRLLGGKIETNADGTYRLIPPPLD
jgi:hypothetical protein